MTADYTIIMSRTLEFARFVPTVKKQIHDFHFSIKTIIIVIIIIAFCDIQNNQGFGRGYQPQPLMLQLITPTHLDFSGYNNNLIQ